MSIRVRLLLAFLLISLIPAVSIIFLTDRVWGELSSLLLDTSQAIIEKASPEVGQSLVSLNGQIEGILQTTEFRISIMIVGVIVSALVLGALFASAMIKPLIRLKKAAEQITQRKLDTIQPVNDTSEFGKLQCSLSAMILAHQEDVANLQARVDVSESQTRHWINQIEVAAQIGHLYSTIHDEYGLLEEFIRYIAGRFGYYHVGIFMPDDRYEYFILRAASSQGGKRLIAQGYRLGVNETTMVSHVVQFGKPSISLDVTVDHRFVRVSELKETHSEVAVPLRVRGIIIGVLDIHSIAVSGFSASDVNYFQIIADQLALALDNIHAQNKNQRLIHELDQAYGHQLVASWDQYLHGVPLCYFFDGQRVESGDGTDMESVNLSAETAPRIDTERNQIIAPVTIRGQVIGSIVLSRDANSILWSEEELLLIQGVMEQIGPALESARLLAETQARASQEQAVNIISTRVRGSVGVDAILQNTVRELGKVLGNSRVYIQLGFETEEQT